MTDGVYRIGSDHFNHQGGYKSPVEKYAVVREGKAYEVHTGCKEAAFDWKMRTYIWTSNGQYLDPSKETHQIIKHFFWVCKNAGLVKDIEDKERA